MLSPSSLTSKHRWTNTAPDILAFLGCDKSVTVDESAPVVDEPTVGETPPHARDHGWFTAAESVSPMMRYSEELSQRQAILVVHDGVCRVDARALPKQLQAVIRRSGLVEPTRDAVAGGERKRARSASPSDQCLIPPSWQCANVARRPLKVGLRLSTQVLDDNTNTPGAARKVARPITVTIGTFVAALDSIVEVAVDGVRWLQRTPKGGHQKITIGHDDIVGADVVRSGGSDEVKCAPFSLVLRTSTKPSKVIFAFETLLAARRMKTDIGLMARQRQ
jgi:hypothetical protein